MATHFSKRRLVQPFALLALTLLASLGANAAEIYVLDSRIERDGRSSLAPTFIVTPGERAVMMYDGERDIDVAMTVLPRGGTDAAEASAESGDGAAFDVRVELIDGMDVFDETIEATLNRPASVQVGERRIELLVRVQRPLDEAASSDGEAASGDSDGN